MKKLLVAGALWLCASIVLAGPLGDGVLAVGRGDYATAFRLWRLAVMQSDADAEFDLGLMYENGRGVLRDDAEAAKWFIRAAAQGHAGAQFNLAKRFAIGQRVPRDYAEAIKWYRLAAAQGHAGAQFNLDLMDDNGENTEIFDYDDANWYRRATLSTYGYSGYADAPVPSAADQLNYFRQSADEGDGEAQLILGLIYAIGQRVPQDYVEAHKWINLAATRGGYSDHFDMPYAAARKRDIVAPRMTPAQIAEAQKLAQDWKPKERL